MNKYLISKYFFSFFFSFCQIIIQSSQGAELLNLSDKHILYHQDTAAKRLLDRTLTDIRCAAKVHVNDFSGTEHLVHLSGINKQI